MNCSICPRECQADRNNGQPGACGVDNRIYVARVALHMWEEPCISGSNGSGTVFFVGCPLGCVYCQNYKISRGRGNDSHNRGTQVALENAGGENSRCRANEVGSEYTIEELADSFIKLQEMGANNINLVTPTHYSYQIIDAVKLARGKGLILPIVYNCSGYEKVETLKSLEDVVDIYLVDFKYMNESIAKEYSRAADYPEIAKLALEEMVSQQGNCTFNEDGMMTKGVIVRNLLLPGNVKNSKDVVKYVYDTYGDDVYISVMNQYTPLPQVSDMKPLNRKATKREYERLVDYVISIGVTNAFIQEGDVASESFIPEFS